MSNKLMSYCAEGHVLDANTRSFGGIGVVAIKDFARFYRYIMLEKQYPHHGAFAFKHVGRTAFDALKLLGVDDISTPKPAGCLYAGENPF